jgi:uncharacterized protein YheU (UPF0270 family)
MTNDDAGKPKYLSDELRNTQTVSDKDATIGISETEALDADSAAKGLRTPGWVTYTTYTDSNGNVRHKSEVLVAAGSMSADTNNATLTDDLSGGAGAGTTFTAGVEFLDATLEFFTSAEGGDYGIIVSANDSTVYDALTTLPVGTVVTVTGTGFNSPATFQMVEGAAGGIGGSGTFNRYFYIDNLSDTGFMDPGNSVGTISF